MRTLDVISVMLEICILVMGILLAAVKKKKYGWGIALTFGVYTFYDLVRFSDVAMPRSIMSVLFLAASASMLWAVGVLYVRK